MELLKAMRTWSVALPAVAIACATSASSPAPVQVVAEASLPIAVPDPSFEILVAATDSVLPRFGPPDERFYINDSLTAKVLDDLSEAFRTFLYDVSSHLICIDHMAAEIAKNAD